MREKPFFVGYLPAPDSLRGFLIGVAVLLIAGLGGAGYILSAGQDDPGPGALRFDYGRQKVTGVVELTPYPILHVTEGNDRIKPGDSFLMTAGNKSGVDSRAEPLAGQLRRRRASCWSVGTSTCCSCAGGATGCRRPRAMCPRSRPHRRAAGV